jgi:hypothetical protein
VTITFNSTFNATSSAFAPVNGANTIVATATTSAAACPSGGPTNCATFGTAASGAPSGISIPIPTTVPAGTYAIVASDTAGNVSAPLYYVITAPTLNLTIAGGYTLAPVAGTNTVTSVPAIPVGGNFLAQNVSGDTLNATTTADAFVSFYLMDIHSTTSVTPTTAIQLKVISCPSNSTVIGGVTPPLDTCAADTSGNVVATVQMAPSAANPAGTTLPAGGFIGQNWAIVAANMAVPTGAPATAPTSLPAGGPPGGCSAAGIKCQFGGLHIANTVASLTPSSPLVAAGAAVTVTGAGFGAGSTVSIFQGTNGVLPVCPPGVQPAGVTTLTSVAADGNGRFTLTYTFPINITTASLVGCDNFGNSGSTTVSLSPGAPTATSAIGLSPTTVSIGQTVNVTATGFAAFDLVTVKVTSSPSTGSAASSCSSAQATVATLVAQSNGNIAGTFTLPTCLVPPPTNDGAVITVTLTGTNGFSATGTLTVRAASVVISQVAGTLTNQIMITGTGFLANENVTVNYVPVGGGTVTAGLSNSVTATTDATGSFSIPSVSNAYGNVSGYYTVTGTGLTSGYVASGVQIVTLGGYLQVPPSVVPGQVFVITGTSFAPGSGTVSVNFTSTPSTVAFTVNSTGTFTTTYTVPTGTPPGSYVVTASAPVPNTTGNQTRSVSITVVALGPSTLRVFPANALVGGTVGISATGYAPNEPIAISVQYTNSALAGQTVPGTKQTGFVADNTGSLTTTATLTDGGVGTLVPGSYNLAVTGLNSGVTTTAPITLTGTLPTTSVSTNIFFAEGFTGSTASGASANFSEAISILNSNNFPTPYTVTYFLAGASAPISVTGTIPAFSVVQRSVNTDAGSNQQVAAEVSAPNPIDAERIITRTTATGANLGASTSLGQALNLSATPPASGFDYYFASGAVQSTNEEYLSILNPNSSSASVTINILPQTAISATTTTTVAPIKETVGANSRLTVPLRKTLLGMGVGSGFQFGMDVNSTLPIAVENILYEGDGTGSGKYGSTTTPAGSGAFRQYVFAADFGVAPSTGLNAGAIGTGNDVSAVNIINPGAAANGSATVTVSFFSKSGSPINSQQIQVDGGTRETVSVNDIAGVNPDVFSVVVTSDKNVYVELPVSFGGDPTKGGTYATVLSGGAVPGLTSAAFPFLDLATGTTGLSTTVFLYNPGASAVTVNAVYSAGSKSATKSYTVAANSITQVNVGADTASLGATTGIGGFYSLAASTPGSFVAFALSNTSDYKVALGTQGTYSAASFAP